MEKYYQYKHVENKETETAQALPPPPPPAVVLAEKKPFSDIQVIIPSWLEHKGGVSITSLDVSIDGTHVATGGADNCCRIWKFQDIAAESDPSAVQHGQPLGLAMFAGPVSCVRWNPKTADVLAVATDDSKVAVLKCVSSATNGKPQFTIFGVEGKFYENYQALHTFTISSTEVPDIAWSPDGKRIASCSLEGVVCIHDVEAKQLLKSITFDGPVKGLSWDPLDRYIAAQSEDSSRSLAIITVPDYEVQQKISDGGMFDKNSCLFFRRLSWSPDGTLLGVCPTLYCDKEGECGKGKSYVMQSATFLRRSDFTIFDCAPGPSKEVNVLRFSRGFYAPGKDEDKVYFPCAMSSLDRLITIRLKAPKKDRADRRRGADDDGDDDDEEADFDNETESLVLRNVCESSVNDLAWTPDGFGLLAATDSGKIIYVRFDSALLGTPCTEAQLSAHLERTHGKKLNYRPPASFYDILETPLQLELEKKASAQPDLYKVHVLTAEEEEIEASKHSEQKVSTKKGRLRITPKLITSAQFNKMISSDSPTTSPAPPMPSSSNTNANENASQLLQGTLEDLNIPTSVITEAGAAQTKQEKVDREDKVSKPSAHTISPIPATTNSNFSNKVLNPAPTEITDTSKLSGKAKPVTVGEPPGSKNGESNKKDLMNKVMDRLSDNQQPSSASDSGKIVRTVSATKRLSSCLEEGSIQQNSASITTASSSSSSSLSSSSMQPKNKRKKEMPDAGEALVVAPAVSSVGQISLRNPESVVRCVFPLSGHEEATAEMEARLLNSNSDDVPSMTRVQLRCGEIGWTAVVRGHVRIATLNGVFCAVGCTDSSLTVLDFRSGRSLLPKINLGNGGVPMLLKANATRHLAVVTNTCELSVFDVAARRAVVSRVLVEPAVLRNEADATLTVTPAGVAVLSCPEAQMAYDPAMGAWVYVARKLRASALERPHDKDADHALALWEAEQELALADLLEDRGEYEAALFRYVHLLSDGDANDADRLRILLDDVLHSKAMEHVCALMKCTRRELLKKLLLVVGRNRKLQRLCEEFNEILKKPPSENEQGYWNILV